MDDPAGPPDGMSHATEVYYVFGECGVSIRSAQRHTSGVGDEMNSLASADLLPEERFLLALATLAPSGEDYRTARELCRRDGFSWDAIYALSVAQRVMPVLALNLEAEAMVEAVPRAVRFRFRRGRVAAKLRNDRFCRLLTGPLTELEERGIAALLLKGAVLSADLFPEGTRALGDVDMLLSKSDCAEAGRVFEAHGFEKRDVWPGAESWTIRSYNEVCYVRQEAGQPFAVDLHWRICPENHAYDLPLARLIGRAVPVSFGSVTVLGTSREDTLVHYATQLGVDEVRVDLGRIADIDALVRAGPDWDRVVGVARAAGAHGALHLALTHLSPIGGPRGAGPRGRRRRDRLPAEPASRARR